MSRCPVPTHLYKKSRRPSGDNAGPASLSDVLTGDPRFTGVSHGSSRDARVATQRSKLSWHPSGVSLPSPPCRFDMKYSASSSLESVGVWSWQGELTGASGAPARTTRSWRRTWPGSPGRARRWSRCYSPRARRGGLAEKVDERARLSWAPHYRGDSAGKRCDPSGRLTDGSRHLFEVKRHGGPKTRPLRRQK